MKKTLLFISTILIGASSYAQYEGFENWTESSIEVLDDYETTANERPNIGSLAASKSTDAYLGSFSLKLESILTTEGDTVFGYFVSGDPEDGAPGQAVTLPPIGQADSVIGYYKSDIMANDSAVFLCETFGLGNTTGGGVFHFYGTHANWTRFSFPINAIASDSLMIAAATGNPLVDFGGRPGSWIQFDAIQLKNATATDDIDNYSFENWSSISWDDPNGYNTSNQWAIGEPVMPVIKSTDMYAGNFAAELTTITNDRGDTINGIVSNGYFDENGLQGGTPYTATPTSFEFYYKNTVVGNDTSWVNLTFNNNGNPVAQNGGYLTPAGSYTYFSQNISFSGTPDTMLFAAFSGDIPGSKLFIDNIDFVFPVGINESITVEKLVAYPNPTTDELKIKFNITNDNNVNIRLVDVTGKELINRSLGNLSSGTYRESFNTSNFTSGVYFVEFTLGNEKTVNRFVVK